LAIPQIPASAQTVTTADGQVQPLAQSPLDSETLPDPATLSKELIHVLESAVIEWAYQVKSVVSARISPKFASGQNPGPRAEVEFW
jgi:dynein heavy chain